MAKKRASRTTVQNAAPPDKPMAFADLFAKYPFLASPALLASHDLGADAMPTPHVMMMGQQFTELIFSSQEDRLIVNAPFRSSKTQTLTKYGAAWVLFFFPSWKVKVLSSTEQLAMTWGFETREIMRRYGPLFGLHLRDDSQAKDDWRIDQYGGRYQSHGCKTTIIGEGFNLGIADDLIADPQDAISEAIMESTWMWFNSAFLSRRDAGAKVLVNNVRWSKQDITGRLEKVASLTGQPWRKLVLQATAGPNDILGRKQGELLWPVGTPMHKQTQVNLADAKCTRWYEPNHQQNVPDDTGKFFKPTDEDGNILWPQYADLGDAYSLYVGGHGRREIIPYTDILIIITIDWTSTDSISSDFMGKIVGGMVPDGRILILDAYEKRVDLEGQVPSVAETCRLWRPHMAGAESDSFQAALANECRRYPEIPEVRRLKAGNQKGAKLARATEAIVMGENSRIFLPHDDPPWIRPYLKRLTDFEGLKKDVDDLVDCTSYLAIMARTLRPTKPQVEQSPCVLIAPPERHAFIS